MAHHATLPHWEDKTPAQKIQTLREMVDDLYHYTLGAVNARILAMLDAAVPYDQAEAESIAHMRPLIQAHSNIISANCEAAHITGSALIVEAVTGRLLLHLHKQVGRWLPVGGHADYETEFSAVALREASEETGLRDLRLYPDASDTRPVDYDLHTIPASHDRPQHLHLDFRFLLVTDQPGAIQHNPAESLDMGWFTVGEVLARDDILPDVKRLAQKAHAQYERETHNG